MRKEDRRVRRTRESLHKALISLALEKNYDSITVQEVLDRADVGRSTFYTHFQSMDELLSLGTQELRVTLNSGAGAAEKIRETSRERDCLQPGHVRPRPWIPQRLLRSLKYGSMADCSAATTGCLGGVDPTRVQGRNCEAEDSEFGRSR